MPLKLIYLIKANGYEPKVLAERGKGKGERGKENCLTEKALRFFIIVYEPGCRRLVVGGSSSGILYDAW